MQLKHSFTLFVFFLSTGFRSLTAEEVRIAVAANFTAPMQEIAARFETETGGHVVVSGGSSGTLYAQIKQGAPFDVYFAADERWVERLADEGEGIDGTQFVYAIGKLALWSNRKGMVDPDGTILKKGDFGKLAISSPKLAPYGAAARETLKAIGVWENVRTRVIYGQNVTQTYQFVKTGGASIAFVALSQISKNGSIVEGSAWIVPEHLYKPLKQSAILLKRSDRRKICVDFLKFLKGESAKAIIRNYGYGIE